MKYNELFNQTEESNPVFVAYRKSAFSPIQKLHIVISGNSLLATDEIHEDDTQLTTIADIAEKIANNESDKLQRYGFFPSSMELFGEISFTLRLGNSYSSSFKVSDVPVQELNEEALLDLIF